MAFPFLEFIQRCASGDYAYVADHISGHPDINYRNENGWNALIVASFEHHYKIVDLLLDNGANIRSCNFKGTTVLMYAKTKCLETGNFEFLDYLLDRGADINAKDVRQLTVLDYVTKLNNESLKLYLLSKGALLSKEIK